jgi:hypothetical protein
MDALAEVAPATVSQRLRRLAGPADYSPLCIADFPDLGGAPRLTLTFHNGRLVPRVNKAMRDLARLTATTITVRPKPQPTGLRNLARRG